MLRLKEIGEKHAAMQVSTTSQIAVNDRHMLFIPAYRNTCMHHCFILVPAEGAQQTGDARTWL